LHAIREVVNAGLLSIGPALKAVCSRIGRPLIVLVKLVSALLLQSSHGMLVELSGCRRSMLP